MGRLLLTKWWNFEGFLSIAKQSPVGEKFLGMYLYPCNDEFHFLGWKTSFYHGAI